MGKCVSRRVKMRVFRSHRTAVVGVGMRRLGLAPTTGRARCIFRRRKMCVCVCVHVYMRVLTLRRFMSPHPNMHSLHSWLSGNIALSFGIGTRSAVSGWQTQQQLEIDQIVSGLYLPRRTQACFSSTLNPKPKTQPESGPGRDRPSSPQCLDAVNRPGLLAARGICCVGS